MCVCVFALLARLLALAFPNQSRALDGSMRRHPAGHLATVTVLPVNVEVDLPADPALS
jgi:hypothetical protein